MKIVLTGEAAVRSETISLGDSGEFHVTVKQPTFEELLRDTGKATDYVEDRLKACIVGWVGLMEEVTAEDGTVTEREIPFNWENFKKLCSQFPQVYTACVRIARDCYNGGTSAKNVKTAPASFSADAVLAQLQGRHGSTLNGLGISADQPASPPNPS